MKRIVVVVVILASSGLYALSREVTPAFACTGFGPIENMLESTVIFEGRVTSVTPNGPKGLDRSPYKLTFEVIRAHKGVAAGDPVVANALIPTGTVPVMCAQFPRDLAGKYVVIGLRPDPEKPGELVAYASVGYVTDSLSGPEYEAMSKLARMHADSDPTAPQLLISPAVARCGEPFTLSGRRFPAGKYLLRYSVSTRFVGDVEAGANGAFELQATMFHDGCRNAAWNGRLVAIHAMDISAGAGTAWSNFDGLVEIGSVALAGTRERAAPTLVVNPNPARCTDILEVRGTGFLPGEQLSLAVGYGARDALVTADSSGGFVTMHGIPADACEEARIEVLVNQAGYETYTSPFYGLAQVSVVRAGPPSTAPGPPDLGTGPGAGSPRGFPVTALTLLVVAVVVVVVANCAPFGWRRK